MQQKSSDLEINWAQTPIQHTPTWSWLSADGAIYYPDLRTDQTSRTRETGLMHVFFQIVAPPSFIPKPNDQYDSLPIACTPIRIRGVLESAICQRADNVHDPDNKFEIVDEYACRIGSMVPDQ
jgi:hypothetical protein